MADIWKCIKQYDEEKFTELLASKPAEANAVNKKGVPLVHHLIEEGLEDWVEIALENGADVNKTDKNGRNALSHALYNGVEDFTTSLLERKVNVNGKDKTGATSLHYAVRVCGEDVVSELLEAGARADVADKDGQTPIHLAASEADENLLSALLERLGDKAKTVSQDKNNAGLTPLHIAASSGFLEGIDLLQKAGASIDEVASGNMSPLAFAVQQGRHDAADLLLRRGATANHIVDDETQHSFLHTAVMNDNADMVSVLVKHGDVNKQDADGNTPLHLAARARFTTLVKMLQGAGADESVANKEGVKPLEWRDSAEMKAKEQEYEEERLRAEVKAKRKGKSAAVAAAARTGTKQKGGSAQEESTAPQGNLPLAMAVLVGVFAVLYMALKSGMV